MNSTESSSDQMQDADHSAKDWLFDAFGEPRTMPTGWDLSEMNGSRKTTGGSDMAQPPAENVEHVDFGPGLHIMYLNPFPEPRTYPVYWNLCR